ncbi:metallophosphoesterase [Streptomonospora litoralis]|uniref:3',5'-cyclic adenosine monophosphate phosphodiesterase CpdA n=1 Tax=Streptomonospora litoralis TaxID=2498135 RepID=A0A4P6Q667_9ACTN|nr:metallophosphoesterase [Streptomonospora litoralis]QBI54277.1 3',5'-cyclic adenosine monophosphate phosphodiesterase CpdA [Streptomonospora litoralis]
MITLAHISDLHVDGGSRARERVEQVMAYLDAVADSVDALVVTGDLTENGTVGELEEARALLSGRLPAVICPGNHDVVEGRAPFRRVMLGSEGGEKGDPGEAPVNAVHRADGGAVVLCDSTVPSEDGGLLSEETLDWLEDTLADLRQTPVVLGFHHHPVKLHTPYVDHIAMQGADRLSVLLARHPQVAGLLCGHAHTAAATAFAQRPLLVAPGTVSVAPLPWEDAEQVYAAHPPALAFHILDDEGRMTTHFRTAPAGRT